MIKVCFAGVTGWTAPPILAAIDAADDLNLTCGVSRSAAGRTLADAAGSRSSGSIYASAAEALRSAEVDVLVDYTSASAVKENVFTAVRAGVHVVVGSSGLTADDYAELDRLARDLGVGVVAAGNFSIMAAILMRAATLAAEYLQHWEILREAGRAQRYLARARRNPGKGPHPPVRDAAPAVGRAGRGTRRRGGWHQDPLGAAAQLRGEHRDRFRWRRGTAGDPP